MSKKKTMPSVLNEYQSNANITAIYPGRRGNCNKHNSDLLDYLNSTWDTFYLQFGEKSFDIKGMVESCTPFNGLFYVSMGLAGEIGELQEKMVVDDGTFSQEAIIGELGDVFWYLSQVCMELDTPMGFLLKINPTYSTTRKIVHDPEMIKWSLLLTLSVWSGRVNEVTKKLLRDSRGHLPPEAKEKILENCAKIYNALVSLCAIIGVSSDYVMEKNIEKLFSRRDRGKLSGSGDNR